MDIKLKTESKRQVVDITEQVQSMLPQASNGVVVITALHTTAGITTADLDPGTDLDLLDALDGMLPDVKWRHPHNPDHAPDHILASIIGPSVALPVRNQHIVLGTWQRVILIELYGPRELTLNITLIKA